MGFQHITSGNNKLDLWDAEVFHLQIFQKVLSLI